MVRCQAESIDPSWNLRLTQIVVCVVDRHVIYQDPPEGAFWCFWCIPKNRQTLLVAVGTGQKKHSQKSSLLFTPLPKRDAFRVLWTGSTPTTRLPASKITLADLVVAERCGFFFRGCSTWGVLLRLVLWVGWFCMLSCVLGVGFCRFNVFTKDTKLRASLKPSKQTPSKKQMPCFISIAGKSCVSCKPTTAAANGSAWRKEVQGLRPQKRCEQR